MVDSVTKYKMLPEIIVNKMGLINASNDDIKHLVDAGYHIMLLCDIIRKRNRKKKLQERLRQEQEQGQ